MKFYIVDMHTAGNKNRMKFEFYEEPTAEDKAWCMRVALGAHMSTMESSWKTFTIYIEDL